MARTQKIQRIQVTLTNGIDPDDARKSHAVTAGACSPWRERLGAKWSVVLGNWSPVTITLSTDVGENAELIAGIPDPENWEPHTILRWLTDALRVTPSWLLPVGDSTDEEWLDALPVQIADMVARYIAKHAHRLAKRGG